MAFIKGTVLTDFILVAGQCSEAIYPAFRRENMGSVSSLQRLVFEEADEFVRLSANSCQLIVQTHYPYFAASSVNFGLPND